MRGQEPSRKRWSSDGGITPADAGTRRTAADSYYQLKGSPPRMRGQGHLEPDPKTAHRITPADAGTSDSLVFDCVLKEDHPRGCGDKLLVLLPLPLTQGSPPRMRGQGRRGWVGIQRERITPADAGTSWTSSVPSGIL